MALNFNPQLTILNRSFNYEPKGVNVNFLTENGKIQQVAAQTINPHQGFSAFINWFAEIFWGKSIVEIKLTPESPPLYIKINELAKILQPPQVEELKKGKTEGFLQEQRTRLKRGLVATENQINGLAKEWQVNLTEKGRQNQINELLGRLGLDAIPEAEKYIRGWAGAKAAKAKAKVEAKEAAEAEKAAAAAKAATAARAATRARKKAIEATKKPGAVAMQAATKATKKPGAVAMQAATKATKKATAAATQAATKATKKATAAATQAATKATRKTKAAAAAPASTKGTVQKNQETIEEEALYRFARELGGDEKALENLGRLGEKVTFASLNKTLQSIESKEDKAIMLRTYIAIGIRLKKQKSIFSRFTGQVRYFKRVKNDKERLTHAFAINKKDIIVVPKNDPLGKGSFKVVSTAIKLNNLATSFVRVKIEPQDQDQDPEAATRAISEVKLEEELLQDLHKNRKKAKNRDDDDSSCLVPPYECRILSKDKSTKARKLVMFQQKLGGGDGARLAGKPARQQLHALRDVARGLAYLHDLEYVHMDMKPANFLLDGDVNSTTPVKGKVSDLGMTCKQGKRIKGGSFAYLPREAIQPAKNNSSVVGGFSANCVATPKIDSFSLGVTIFELVTGSPLKVGTPQRVFGLLSQAEIDQVLTQEEQNISGDATNKMLKLQMLDIARQLIKQQPGDRITCQSAAAQLGKLIT